MAKAVAVREPKVKAKEARAPHDETSETLGNLTLSAVAVLYVVLIAVGYFSGAMPEDTQMRALIAAAAVGAVGWLLTELVGGVMAPSGAGSTDTGRAKSAGALPADEDETA